MCSEIAPGAGATYPIIIGGKKRRRKKIIKRNR
jgi:hypothetical protein